MRDVRDFKVGYTRTYTGPTGSNTSTGTVQSVRSQRSDSVSTAPPPWGITGYRAFFMLATFSAGKTEWHSSNTGAKHSFAWDKGELPSSVWRTGANSSLNPDIPNWMLSQVRSRLDNQIREDLDISVFAGEARETARFLVSTLGQILKGLNTLRRLFRSLNTPRGSRHHYSSWGELIRLTVRAARQRARRGDRLASAYLWYMYAVRPLVSDVVKVCKHWDERLNAPISKQIFAECEDTLFGPPLQKNRSAWGTFRRGVKSGADVVVLDPQLLRASQYGLTSPLSLAWELTTLSFVVDWFTGIGSFIRTLESPLGVAIVNYYETQWANTSFFYIYDVYSDLYKNQFTVLDVEDKERVHVTMKCMLRSSGNRILPAPPYLSIGSVGSSQAISLLALISARSSGK
ncbi:TPA_asm: maturation protein [ssRNA phage SRR5467090_2]|uniref:Maturation protein n=1 Tax=ssRNA phage SRR5467090_2 TaxID=2786451 RepID=A0A8S5KZZ7_9VIRU|nr:maturation protein [ssRNA phage SRR5467090_2]DAD50888.1 TPA_asm: maturation protein [ssRNA phage SRR5467090_2]